MLSSYQLFIAMILPATAITVHNSHFTEVKSNTEYTVLAHIGVWVKTKINIQIILVFLILASSALPGSNMKHTRKCKLCT